MNKEQLTIDKLIIEAKDFCIHESKVENQSLFGITDGKAVGTYIEHKFQNHLLNKFTTLIGSSASGIDLPDETIKTDIKVTSIKQPQSSCPFKDAKQKIFGLGYNLLIFVYDKTDNQEAKTSLLNFIDCTFISSIRTADYTITFRLREMLLDKANIEDIIAYLTDRNIPADEITLKEIAKQIIETPPLQGYLTISNALQWRLQYQRIVSLKEQIDGIHKVFNTNII